jgi:ferredoxin
MDKEIPVVSRRQWFLESVKLFGRLAGEIADAGRDVETPSTQSPLDPARGLLLPPYAGPESEFARLCDKCGDCITACPENVLFPAPPSFGEKAGYPTFDPRRKACFFCSELHCVKSCKPGALAVTDDPGRAVMGKARINPALCKARADEECSYCFDFCPLKGKAIIKLGGIPAIMASECIGCGLCEYHCHHNAGASAIVTLPRVI